METRTQTFTKALSWEAISFLLTLGVSYLFLGNVEEATELSVVLFTLKVVLLFWYERIFRRVRKWQKRRAKKS